MLRSSSIRRGLALGITGAVALGVAGVVTAKPAKQTAGPLVAMLLPENVTARWEGQDKPLFANALKKLVPGVQVQVQNALNDPAKQQAQAETALVKGAKVLVVAAVDQKAAAVIVTDERRVADRQRLARQGAALQGNPSGNRPLLVGALVSSTQRSAGGGGGAAAAPSRDRRPLLEAHGISKHFGAVQALTDVDFEVFPGEVVALVGDNGAGKSTLIKCLAGVYQGDAGRILFEGREVKIHSPMDATRLGIETVYQDLALCDNLDVVANMFLGREEVGAVPPVPRPLSEVEMERRSLEVLRGLNVTTIGSVRARVAALSGGQRQSVAISRAVLWNSKVVILDEPTAALGVVVITHNIAVVFEVADRIVVLRLGRRVAMFERAETTTEEVVTAIIGGRKDVII